MGRGRVKGQRSFDSFNKSFQKLIDELELTKKKLHPVYKEYMDFYVNSFGADIALKLLSVLFKRLEPSKMPRILYLISKCQSVKSTELMKEIYGDKVNMEFWLDIYKKGEDQFKLEEDKTS